MDVEVVTVGTELLLGLTVDTNTTDLAGLLAPAGVRIVRRTSVPDDEGAIRGAVTDALSRRGTVIVSGGLGPTRDDVTKRAVASLFGRRLVLDQAYFDALERRWTARGRPAPMPAANRSQAEYPEGAMVLPNPRGSAPGIWLDGPPGCVVLLPGVPHELRGIVREELLPRLAARAGAVGGFQVRTLRTTGRAESALADLIGPLEETFAPVTLAYLPIDDGVDLRLMHWGDPALGEPALDRVADQLCSLLGETVYGEGDIDLAARLLELLRARGDRLAVAESCTGGLIGGRLTAVPGASAVFAGGVIAYNNDLKQRMLDVPSDVLEAHGAVSGPAVEAMARGAARRCGATCAIAVSGIAGPDGGTDAKPVGTVWLAALAGDVCRVGAVWLPGDRFEVRVRATAAALDLLRRLVLPA